MSHSSDLAFGDLPPVAEVAHFAAVSYLSRYDGNTLVVYRRALRDWFNWCLERHLDPLRGIVRQHIEVYVRYLEVEKGNRPSTVKTMVAPIRGYFHLAAADGLIDRDPALLVRMPRVQNDPLRKTGLTRHELGVFLSVSEMVGPMHSAMIHLLGLLGLRISEACAVNIEDFADREQGYRVLRITGKGNKSATLPLSVPVHRALEIAQGDRASGPLILNRNGRRADRKCGAVMIRTVAKRAGIEKQLSPHSLRRAAITAALDAGIALRDVQTFARHEDPRTTMTYDLGHRNLDRHATHVLSAYVATGRAA